MCGNKNTKAKNTGHKGGDYDRHSYGGVLMSDRCHVTSKSKSSLTEFQTTLGEKKVCLRARREGCYIRD